ncbi:MAG: RusA family crossover junction endodeoxyribonuclease [Alphaproteobacteria bacterium]|nr:RusA family crossover junction endodeoxyribonuclease [Alphaproteobacteria bacterium]
MVGFTIPGKPFAKQRPKASIAAGRARVYTPKETVSFENKVAEISRPHFPAPIEGPVKLRIVAVFAIPTSWSKRKQAEAEGQHHTQKPDADNIAKAIKDGMNRIAWRDDCQVADVRCVKRWGRYAETYVQAEALAPSDQLPAGNWGPNSYRDLRDQIVGEGA